MAEMLSSEVLESQFGPVDIEVIHQAGSTRAIATKVLSTGQILEVSLVKFIAQGADQYPDVHQEIVQGESMGKAFAAHRVPFHRNMGDVYTAMLPPSFQKIFESESPATIIEVAVGVGEEETPYAEILETYSPAVHWPSFQGEPATEQRQKIRVLDTLLNNWRQ